MKRLALVHSEVGRKCRFRMGNAEGQTGSDVSWSHACSLEERRIKTLALTF
jgi:hypothetical protein